MKRSRTLSDLQLIYLLAVANAVVMMLIIRKNGEAGDTIDYINAWESFRNFKINIWRTPVYPVFIGLILSLGGNYLTIIVLQHLFFIISLGFLYGLLLKFSKSNRISFWCTIFYIAIHWIFLYQNFILTESISVSASIMMLSSAVKLAENKENKEIRYALSFTFWLCFLIFLRPAFVYMIPVFFVAWTIFCFIQKNISKNVMLGISGTCLVSVFLLLYMFQFRKNFGLLTPSAIGTVNEYFMARNGEYLDYNYTNEEEFKSFIQNKIIENPIDSGEALYWEAREAIETFGLLEVQSVVSKSKENNFPTYIKKLFGRFYRSSQSSWGSLWSIPGSGWVTTFYSSLISFAELFGILNRLNLLYLFLLVTTIILIHWIVKKNNFPWYFFLFYMLGVSNLIVAIVGAQGEFGRLVYPSLPIYLLMLAQLLSFLRIDKKGRLA